MAKKKGSKADGIPSGMYKHKSGQIIPVGKSVNKAGEVIDKKVVDKRSISDLKGMGPKGALIVATQRAFSLSKDKGFSGSVLSEYSPKAVNGVLYVLTKRGGKILTLDESGDLYNDIIRKAKAAKGDIVGNELTPAVNNFIDAVVGIPGAGGGGGGKRSGAVLADFSFD